MSPLPWHAIKIPLLVLFAVAVLAGAGVWWSSSKLVQAEAARKQQTQANQAAREKLKPHLQHIPFFPLLGEFMWYGVNFINKPSEIPAA